MNVQEAINKRRSTRYYDTSKKVNKDDIKLVVDAGRRAPNGLALEPWKFFVIEGDMSKLQETCYGQPHAGDASFAIALVNYKTELIEEKPEVISDLLKAKGIKEENIVGYIEKTKQIGTQYMREQTMFAGSQMVLQATELGIGSVIMGGFDREKVANLINLDQVHYEVALVIDFGYPVEEEVKPRVIRDEEEVVSYINL